MIFKKKLEKIIKENNSLLCIGLDTDINKIPKHLLKEKDPVFAFNKGVIDGTFDLVCAYKPNMAFYEAMGIKGLESLKRTVDYLKTKYPHIPTICDAKRGDIGSTAQMYAKSAFDYFEFDSITINPYLGTDSVEPFLEYKDKGIIILCKTSNKGSLDFQSLETEEEMMYIKVAKKILEWNKKYGNCAMVIGATWPEEIKKIRELNDEIFLLVPGIGTQGGDMKKTIMYGVNSRKSGLIINISRAIIYASNNVNFVIENRNKALTFRNEVNKYRNG
ncbi:orotidine-5'-phosphate decarboxylase [Patescibacteria group bacterium]|nr:orotidine-5'-phosphate decarboxylase [Patescibacteria group bacterium]